MITGDEALYWAKKLLGKEVAEKVSDLIQMITDLTAVVNGKVDKVTGKGLSANDFTNALKTKLDGIESGAQVNTVTGVKGDSETTYKIGNVNITKANIGLSNVDDTSDADKPVSTATQSALDNKLDAADLILFDVVTPSFSSLPQTFYSSYLKSTCNLVGNAVHLSEPNAGDIDWDVTFTNGSLTISGTFHGSTATTARMSIWKPTKTLTLTSS